MGFPLNNLSSSQESTIAADEVKEDEASVTVKSQVTDYFSHWNEHEKTFRPFFFSLTSFRKLVEEQIECFPKLHDPSSAFGIVEKKDLPEGTRIFVRADLHGDLKSLLENLRSLQEHGLMDEDFKCSEQIHLVFLGDYADRGHHSLQVLELLMLLRKENRGQVTLIRGNHESSFINSLYKGNKDRHFQLFLEQDESIDLLESLYQTMPLSLYISQSGPESREYVQFTHGLFELDVNVSSLFNHEGNQGEKVIDIERQLHYEVRNLADLNPDQETDPAKKKQILSAKKVANLFKGDELGFDLEPERGRGLNTAFSWGDVARYDDLSEMYYHSSLGLLGTRTWKLNPEDIRHVMRMSCIKTDHKVKFLFRGHEHEKQHHLLNGKVLISTMPVGADSVYQQQFPGQQDTAYILTLAPKIKDWKKQAYLRHPGSSKKQITAEFPLRSDRI